MNKMVEQEQELTEQQAQAMIRELAEQKRNQFTFFHDVVLSEDTTKTGNLTEEELGEPNLPLRTCEELELFSRDICGQTIWADYFKAEGEILAATSLSRDAMLLKLAVTSKKELADVTPSKKKNSGWFKKKQPTE